MADHERIWLQGCGEPACDDTDCRDEAGRTWCVDKIHDNDTEYVRADLFAELERENAALRELVKSKTPASLTRTEHERLLAAVNSETWVSTEAHAAVKAELRAALDEAERLLARKIDADGPNHTDELVWHVGYHKRREQEKA